MKARDRITALLMAGQRPDATLPIPWPVPPGEAPLRAVPPSERDAIERLPTMNGHDANAVQGDDLMRQYLWPQDYPQEEEA